MDVLTSNSEVLGGSQPERVPFPVPTCQMDSSQLAPWSSFLVLIVRIELFTGSYGAVSLEGERGRGRYGPFFFFFWNSLQIKAGILNNERSGRVNSSFGELQSTQALGFDSHFLRISFDSFSKRPLLLFPFESLRCVFFCALL